MKKFLIKNYGKFYFCQHAHKNFITKDGNYFLQGLKLIFC